MNKPIIAPSLLSANFLDLRADIENINRSEADWMVCSFRTSLSVFRY